ncbi:MAG: NADH-quinone oxidoreductase subunit N [Anaerolineae bacterium]
MFSQSPELNLMPLYPLLVITGWAVLVLLVDLFVHNQRVLGYLALIGVIVTGVITFALWPGVPTSFQNMAVSDASALFFNLVFLSAGVLGVLVAIDYLEHKDLQRGEYYVLLLFALGGMMTMAAAQDLLIVFLGLETMSVALYVLSGFNQQQWSSIEAAMKYFILGAFASAFFLYGIALTYAAAGSTNLAQIGGWLARGSIPKDPMALAGLSLLLVGFGFKVALVPFQWWTPDVYQGAPTSVTAFMSAGAKTAGFAAMLRVLYNAFSPAFTADWVVVTAVLAAVTMTFGNLAALVQRDVKRLLGYSSIAHAGYALVGVAAVGGEGMRGVLFYMLAYTLMTVGAFAVTCAMERREQTTTTLKDYAGLARRAPLLAAAMLLFMLSLIGIPPLVGFWGKLFVFRAAVEANMTWLAVLGVLNSALSAYYYVGVIVQMYLRDPEHSPLEEANLAWRRSTIGLAIFLAVAATVLLGIWPDGVVNLLMGL